MVIILQFWVSSYVFEHISFVAFILLLLLVWHKKGMMYRVTSFFTSDNYIVFRFNYLNKSIKYEDR